MGSVLNPALLGRKTGSSCVLLESGSVKLDRAMRPMRKSEKYVVVEEEEFALARLKT